MIFKEYRKEYLLQKEQLEGLRRSNEKLERALEESRKSMIGLEKSYSDQAQLLLQISEKLDKQSAEFSSYRRYAEEEHFLLAFSEWWSWGATDTLLHMYKMLERHTIYWKTELPAFWVVYLCCLLEKGEQSHARDVMQKIVNQFGIGELICYLPAAAFAYKTGLERENPEIQRSAKIYEVMCERMEGDNSFFQYLQGKTIAVVGNSDSEMGKKRGYEIDSHDVVIRFNNYYHQKPVGDYGEKTTVWVRNGQSEPIIPNLSDDLSASAQYRFVIYADDCMHTFVTAELLPAMERDFQSTRFRTISISAEIHRELRKNANLANPTSGAYIIWYLYRLLGGLKDVDFYGFSFLSGTLNTADCHGKDLFMWHEMSTETAFFKRLIDCERSNTADNCEGGADN